MSDSPVSPDDTEPAAPATPAVDPAVWAEYERRLVAIVAALPEAATIDALDSAIDDAVAAAEAAHPPFRCRQACFECCEATMPIVTAAEWRLLHAAIAAKGDSFQQELFNRTAKGYRQQIDALALLAARLRGEPAYLDGVDEIGLVACSFLQDGRCSVYDARPAMCRAFGYMTVVEAEGVTPLMCPPAVAHIVETFPESHVLPRWEPFQAHLNRLTRHQGIAHLPLWIMAQHDLGGYLVAPIADPMGWAVKRMSRSELVTDPIPPLPVPEAPIGRPPVDQGLGLALGKPVTPRPRTFGFGTGHV